MASTGVILLISSSLSSLIMSSSFTVSKKVSCCISTSSGLGTALRWAMLALTSAISLALAVMSALLSSSAISLALRITDSGTPASLATWIP